MVFECFQSFGYGSILKIVEEKGHLSGRKWKCQNLRDNENEKDERVTIIPIRGCQRYFHLIEYPFPFWTLTGGRYLKCQCNKLLKDWSFTCSSIFFAYWTMFNGNALIWYNCHLHFSRIPLHKFNWPWKRRKVRLGWY